MVNSLQVRKRHILWLDYILFLKINLKLVFWMQEQDQVYCHVHF